MPQSFRATWRRVALATALCAFLSGLAAPLPRHAQAAQSPDIVLILTDDQRWDTLWAMPTVQRELVGKGVYFRNGMVVNPLCCPSRVTMLTGQYSHTTGVYRNSPPHGGFVSFDDSTTVATELQEAGYRTALVGKYLNGYVKKRAGYVPPGWDKWFALTGGAGNGGYYGFKASVQGDNTDFDESNYSTDVFADEAAQFIRSTPATDPLFLFFAPKAPHGPAIPAKRHEDAFSNLQPYRPPNYNEEDTSDKPAWLRRRPLLSAAERADIDRFRADQYRTLLAVDEAVGQILLALEETGRLSNTLVVFASDNGYMWGEHRLRSKGAAYEEAARIPLVARYDALVQEPRSDGRLVLNLDFAPTFLELAGLPTGATEGVSFLPLLSGPADWRNGFLIEHMQGAKGPAYCALRSETHTYVRYETEEEELYVLESDPYQLRNRANDDDLHNVLLDLRRRTKSMCDPLPPGWDGTY